MRTPELVAGGFGLSREAPSTSPVFRGGSTGAFRAAVFFVPIGSAGQSGPDPGALLKEADRLAWLRAWSAAEPRSFKRRSSLSLVATIATPSTPRSAPSEAPSPRHERCRGRAHVRSADRRSAREHRRKGRTHSYKGQLLSPRAADAVGRLRSAAKPLTSFCRPFEPPTASSARR